jgi:cephalosporin hydroxylase
LPIKKLAMLKVDIESRTVIHEVDGESRTYSLDAPEAFELLTEAWLRSGWEAKQIYTFTWFGRPIIQLPEDLIRTQEVIYKLRPDVIVETGVAHGGSLVFWASLFEALHHGRVIGVDIEIRPHNRKAIEAHELFHRIALVEGSSIDPRTFAQVRSQIKPGESVMVLLDSNHGKEHVLEELRLYSELVPVGSYIVATDCIRKSLVGAPRSVPEWSWDHPIEAAHAFLAENKNFELHQPKWEFDESVGLREPVTHWPEGWLLRVK